MNFSNIARQLNEDNLARDAEMQSSENATASGQKQIDDNQRRREKQKSQMSTQKNTPVKSDVTYASEGYKDPDLSNHKSVIDKIRDKGGDEDKEDRIHDSIDRMRDDPKEMRNSGRAKERSNRLRGKKKGFTKDISVMSKGMNESRLEREYVKMMSNQSVDWRKDLIEAAQPDEEGNHPYVDVMPFVNQKQNEAKRQEKGAAKVKEEENVKMSEDVMSDLKASQGYFKKRAARSPEEKASQEKKDASSRAKNYAANRNNNIGQMDHSKKND